MFTLGFLVALSGCGIFYPRTIAKSGILDASKASPDFSVFAEGSWEVYPDRFLFPEDFLKSKDIPPPLISNFMGGAELFGLGPAGRQGNATYRLKVLPPSGIAGPVEVRVPAALAYRNIFVNGTAMESSSILVPANESAGIEMVIHVDGTALPPAAAIRIGSPKVVMRGEVLSFLLTLFPSCFLLVAGCYYLFYYFYFRTEGRTFSSLLLGIFFSLLAIRLFLGNISIVYSLWPSMPLALWERLSVLILYASLLSMLAAVRQLYALAIKARVVDVVFAAVCLATLALVVPGPLFRTVALVVAVAVLAFVIYLIVVAIRPRAGIRAALVGPAVMVSLGFLVLVIVENILVPRAAFFTLYLRPAVMLAFSLIQSFLLISISAGSALSAETLTEYAENITNSVKRFIPHEFLSILNKENITDLNLGDHVEKVMTIFFSDIRAFTQLSETLTTEENFRFINSYLSRVVPIVTEHHGFVDKYIGDAIMALYPNEVGAEYAVQSAIAMQQKLVEYNQDRAKAGYRALSMGIGIHTGTLMLGVVGVSDRMESTVISDAVNLASRLESITKAFNISMAISEQTFKSLDDPGKYKYRFIGKVKVKGKREPISVFEIFDGISPENFEKKMKANMFFEQGMINYYQKDFHEAVYFFKQTLQILPDDGAAMFYLKHCLTKS